MPSPEENEVSSSSASQTQAQAQAQATSIDPTPQPPGLNTYSSALFVSTLDDGEFVREILHQEMPLPSLSSHRRQEEEEVKEEEKEEEKTEVEAAVEEVTVDAYAYTNADAKLKASTANVWYPNQDGRKSRIASAHAGAIRSPKSIDDFDDGGEDMKKMAAAAPSAVASAVAAASVEVLEPVKRSHDVKDCDDGLDENDRDAKNMAKEGAFAAGAEDLEGQEGFASAEDLEEQEGASSSKAITSSSSSSPVVQHVRPGAYRVTPGAGGPERLNFEPQYQPHESQLPRQEQALLDAVHDNEGYAVGEAHLVPDYVVAEHPLPLRKTWRYAAVGTLTAVIILGIILGVTLTREPNNNRPTLAPTTPPTAAPTTLQAITDELVDEFRSTLPASTVEALGDASTPQYRAFSWVTSKDQPPIVNSEPLLRLTQRFALATLFYGTGGEGGAWLKDTNWLSYGFHECEWWGCNCSSINQDRILQGLVLEDNRLVKKLPDEIGLLTNLRDLYLWGNALTGSIPTGIGSLTNLVNLKLSKNRFSGSLPTQVGLLTNLYMLYLSDNNITGTVSTYFGRLTGLIELDFSENSLHGTIPTEIGDMSSLSWLNLASHGNLNGTLPLQLRGLTQLTTLVLYDNDFTGPLPSELGLFTELTLLNLHQNPFTGSVPTELAKLTNLGIASIFESELTGTVPTEVCGLVSKGLDLVIDCTDVECSCGCSCFENRSDDYNY